jgi:hypothetical protein
MKVAYNRVKYQFMQENNGDRGQWRFHRYSPVRKSQEADPAPIGKRRLNVGAISTVRIAGCVPFAPLASFAFNGSAHFDVFSLPQTPSATSKNATIHGLTPFP